MLASKFWFLAGFRLFAEGVVELQFARKTRLLNLADKVRELKLGRKEN